MLLTIDDSKEEHCAEITVEEGISDKQLLDNIVEAIGILKGYVADKVCTLYRDNNAWHPIVYCRFCNSGRSDNKGVAEGLVKLVRAMSDDYEYDAKSLRVRLHA
jgi:hypothetical protein